MTLLSLHHQNIQVKNELNRKGHDDIKVIAGAPQYVKSNLLKIQLGDLRTGYASDALIPEL